jgi:hypothetical protein
VRLHLAGLAIALASVNPGFGVAQDVAPDDTRYRVITEVDTPRGADAAIYRDGARRLRIETDAIYVSELEGTLASGPAPRQRSVSVRSGRDTDLGGFTLVIAVAVLMGLLLVWLKFGGSGVLLARQPEDDRAEAEAPDSWNLQATPATETGSLLERIAAMQDRSAALVLLLRHCLLAGARATGTRLARADTERAAFRRIPHSWPRQRGLEALLVQTELAHYGGRPVAEEAFAQALETGRTILADPALRRAAHG